ncbi:hypothetical protein ACFVP8_16005 [Viridibacillus arvi]|uniref:hypothetical protein n=1 Tax=Viridibacillus arvi TaxID=263475 RepID=UPI0036B2D095
MNKTMQWIIWILTMIVINLSAFLIASFSLFGTQEGTSIFSLDYAIAFGIIVVANIITTQLYLAIRKGDQKGFVYGLFVVLIQAISLFMLTNTIIKLSFILISISILAAMVLLFFQCKKQ